MELRCLVAPAIFKSTLFIILNSISLASRRDLVEADTFQRGAVVKFTMHSYNMPIISTSNSPINSLELLGELQRMTSIEPSLKDYTVIVESQNQSVGSLIPSLIAYEFSASLKSINEYKKLELSEHLRTIVLLSLFIDCRTRGPLVWRSPNSFDPSASLKASLAIGWSPVFVNVDSNPPNWTSTVICDKIESNRKLLMPLCNEVVSQRYSSLEGENYGWLQFFVTSRDRFIAYMDLETCLIAIVAAWLIACLVIAIMLKRRDHRRLALFLANNRNESDVMKGDGPSRSRARHSSKPVIVREVNLEIPLSNQEIGYTSSEQCDSYVQGKMSGQDSAIYYKGTLRNQVRVSDAVSSCAPSEISDDEADELVGLERRIPHPNDPRSEWGPIVFLKQAKNQTNNDDRGGLFL